MPVQTETELRAMRKAYNAAEAGDAPSISDAMLANLTLDGWSVVRTAALPEASPAVQPESVLLAEAVKVKAIAAARDAFKQRCGITIYLPGEGTLDDIEQERYDALVDAISAYVEAADLAGESRAVPDGWQLVPKEPTEAMLDAYWHQSGESKEMRSRTHSSARYKYAALLSAAPAQPVEAQTQEKVVGSEPVLIGCEDGDISCDRCSGTGNLIKDWDRYVAAKTTEEIEDCESDCPDCSGYGRFKAETPPPAQTQPVEAQEPDGWQWRHRSKDSSGEWRPWSAWKDGRNEPISLETYQSEERPLYAAPQPAVAVGEEWLPIDDATPRDGSTLLLAHDKAVLSGWWDADACGWVDGCSNNADELITYPVTHWRPLPAPPAALHGSEKGE